MKKRIVFYLGIFLLLASYYGFAQYQISTVLASPYKNNFIVKVKTTMPNSTPFITYAYLTGSNIGTKITSGSNSVVEEINRTVKTFNFSSVLDQNCVITKINVQCSEGSAQNSANYKLLSANYNPDYNSNSNLFNDIGNGSVYQSGINTSTQNFEASQTMVNAV